MKTVVKIIIKIIGTPAVCVFVALMLLVANIERIYNWAYDVKEIDREVNASLREDMKSIFKRWFTQL